MTTDTPKQVRLSDLERSGTEHTQPKNADDAYAGNPNAIRHIAYAEGYEAGKAAERERCARAAATALDRNPGGGLAAGWDAAALHIERLIRMA